MASEPESFASSAHGDPAACDPTVRTKKPNAPLVGGYGSTAKDMKHHGSAKQGKEPLSCYF